ncbi:helix-turn-helix domain-containing protein [Microbacterium sp. NPDC089189]|uniref:helix-turn-helix domain-containing protein n=1 Tax=Microbacterium sp. NPDC089189 TaxID=3154972 RepID=UPI003417FD9C
MTESIAPAARPRLLFVEEVARELRRSEASVRWLIATKRLKTGKVGGRVVVKPEDLDAFIESGFVE